MLPSELAAGNGLCEGDSGSGAYEPTSLAAGKPIVMGVLSRAGDSAGQCIDAIYGRTDTASALLVNAAKEAAALGGYAVPPWADPSGALADAGAPPDPSAPGVDPTTPDAGSTSTSTSSGCSLTTRAPSRSGAPFLLLVLAGLVALCSRRAKLHRDG
jgi:hypothetical protein